jgi:hypothetical protein
MLNAFGPPRLSTVVRRESPPLKMKAKRALKLFVWHAAILVIAPQILLTGVLAYGLHWPIPFFFYCFPVYLIFPNRYRAHAAIIPEDAVAWALLVLFYLAVALLTSCLHALMTSRKIAQPGAAPNGGPTTPGGNAAVTEGPPSVS